MVFAASCLSARSSIRQTQASVQVGIDRSDPFEYAVGVRQGYPTSQIRFILCIDDLHDGLSGIQVEDVTISGLLSADDAVIFAESAQALQDDLGRIEQTYVSAGKCHLMLPSVVSWCTDLERVSTVVCLVRRYQNYSSTRTWAYQRLSILT